MWLLLVLLALFLGLLLYLLFTPLWIEADSRVRVLRVRYGHTAGIQLRWTGTLLLDIRVPFWRKQIDLLKKRAAKKKKPEQVKQQKKKSKRPPFWLIWALMKSFDVRRFWLTIDTGDDVLNGQLYPYAYAVAATTGANVSINFTGECEMVLLVRNSGYRVLREVIKQRLRRKKV